MSASVRPVAIRVAQRTNQRPRRAAVINPDEPTAFLPSATIQRAPRRAPILPNFYAETEWPYEISRATGADRSKDPCRGRTGRNAAEFVLASNQSIAWHITSDPHWSASLISMTHGPSSHRAKDRAGAATKHRFELLVEGKLVLRATLQKTLIWIDSCSTGPWQTWFAA